MNNELNIPLEEDGIEEEILVDEETAITKAMWGGIGGNIENQTDLQNALDAKQDSLTEAQLNAVNSGITAEKVTTYDGYADQIASKANQSALNAEATTREQADTALGRRIDDEATARQNADNGLQTQIDAITSKSDVVDVVANYAALQAYDTSTLGNNDVIKVLDDETHEDALTYYRWSTTTQTWSYIGQEAPYYSKGQMDVMFQGKQDKLTAGANIQIQNGVISATDTTYTAGNGLNLNGTEFSADTDVLATKEDLEDYYTKPETDNLLAPKLEAEVVAELPTTGEEGKLYLTPKAHTTQTATGNPITATVAEEAGALESFQLDGDTFQQTYTGKNLCPPADRFTYGTNGGATNIAASGNTVTFTSSTGSNFSGIIIYNNASNVNVCPELFTSGYIFSCTASSTDPIELLVGTSGSPTTVNIGTTPTRISAPLTSANFIAYNHSRTESTVTLTDFQVELGSTATDFEPYVGGQASPNPDYPQPIQTVTGTQTITINGTDYPLDLGSIELCKLGTYQDYIYKSGGKWYVHKATGKQVLASSDITLVDSYSNVSYAVFPKTMDNIQNGNYDHGDIVNFFSAARNMGGMPSGGWNSYNTDGEVYNNATRAAWWCSFTKATTLATMRSKLTGMAIVYALATATDTTITDQTLIAQLEAIRTAMLQNGANTITNTAAGSNLAGDMEIGYYGFAPRNRYDKWLWLDINNEYEQIGS